MHHKVLLGTLVLIWLYVGVQGFQIFGNAQKPVDLEQLFDKRPMTAYSFKAPFYLVRGTIPFWKFEGSTVVTDDFVRLTPAEQSRKGAIWTTKPHAFDNWEVEMRFKAGSQASMGADGLAFWYVEGPYREGPVYGSADNWKGLAIMFDTFDNDAQGDNPRIGALVNDGTWSYGDRDPNGYMEVGGCRCMYRNIETQVKVQYFEGQLQVLYKLNPNADWTLCMLAKTPGPLPQGYHFGLSAATGGLSDNHDVYSFEAFRLIPKAGQQNQNLDQVGFQQQEAQRQEAQRQLEFQQQHQQRQEQIRQQLEQQQQQQQQEPQGDDNRFEEIKDRLNKIKERASEAEPKKQEPVKSEHQHVPPPIDDEPPHEPVHTLPPQVIPKKEKEPPKPKKQQKKVPEPEPEPEPEVVEEDYGQFAGDVKDIREDINTLAEEFHDVVEEVLVLSRTVQRISEAQTALTEAMSLLVQNLPSKTDFEAVLDSVHGLGQQLADQKSSGAQNTNNRNVDQLMTSFQGISQNIQSIQSALTDIRNRVDATKQSQSSLEQNIKKNNEQIHSTIESSSSVGWWIYLIVFQAMFGVAFMWWKKARDDSNKKLW